MSGNIILIDDHTLFRRGIRSVLDEADYEVIGEAADGLSGVKLVEQLRPDLVLLDFRYAGDERAGGAGADTEQQSGAEGGDAHRVRRR